MCWVSQQIWGKQDQWILAAHIQVILEKRLGRKGVWIYNYFFCVLSLTAGMRVTLDTGTVDSDAFRICDQVLAQHAPDPTSSPSAAWSPSCVNISSEDAGSAGIPGLLFSLSPSSMRTEDMKIQSEIDKFTTHAPETGTVALSWPQDSKTAEAEFVTKM